MDLVLSRSYMSYCILFWPPSTVLRAFIKSHGFGPFSQLYELLHTVWGPSKVSGIFLAFIKTRGFGPFLELSELLHYGLGFVDNFEGISGIYQKL